ncbi:L-threonylcarbamoyladenylate synthase [Lacihabitans soyangensis]|uniref:Threonylcarbamoyl-AMP synthase n=1 Tax=Lacihabitans soyangensis TaxID=869394 RepID=A0AAE3KUH4_9BACT|nr:L-threonylcarbamoyladenylate synthase [Lacihabitans soyangensis]MCP9765053.1 threonylcarbamoyl-AMP synthase [Lacihabitans soyangensis]
MRAEIGIDNLKAKDILDNGGLVGIPTETVYGLAANALDPLAVSNIYAAKNRPSFDPLIIHVGEIADFQKYTVDFPVQLLGLAEKFCPGPITFLVKKSEIIPEITTSGLEKVAIRIPKHPLTLELLNSLNFPLAAPSANPFGYVSPTTAHHVYEQLGEKIPYILDGGPSKVGLESTIVGIENERLIIYRKGGLDLDEIRKVFSGEILINDHSSSNPQAPGMLDKHYSPNKRIEILNDFSELQKIHKESTGFLRFNTKLEGFENQILLSEAGNLNEAAFRLFDALRQFDKMEIEKVFIELVPEKGLGVAINDRLRRAAAKS